MSTDKHMYDMFFYFSAQNKTPNGNTMNTILDSSVSDQ